jgi:hypothetical protein
MDRLARAAVLTNLIQELREAGSWCGETHVQKAAFFLQELMQIPLGLDFVLYKHGPFSFDLRDELTGLRADGLVSLEPQWPYGPRIAPTERTDYIQRLFKRTLGKYRGAVSFIAGKLGGKDVSELECLATALYVTERSEPKATVSRRAEELTRLKPHIPYGVALRAVEAVDRIKNEAREHAI